MSHLAFKKTPLNDILGERGSRQGGKKAAPTQGEGPARGGDGIGFSFALQVLSDSNLLRISHTG